MLRAFISSAWYLSLLCGLSLIWLPTDIAAETLNLPPPVNQVSRPHEPFGLPTANVTTGTLLDRWLRVEEEMEAERLVIRSCEENRASCASRAALQFLSIIDSGRTSEGRGRLGKINRAVNLSIRPMSDLSINGEEDVWSSPLSTLGIGAGDCEDYAIAKFLALQEAGVSSNDLRIVLLRDNFRGNDHAVLAARLDGNWLILDNRSMAMVEDRQIPNFRPVFLIDHDGVKLYIDPSSTPNASQIVRRLEFSLSKINIGAQMRRIAARRPQ
jgi:predicted transglutaminase-like cysteine proteinase